MKTTLLLLGLFLALSANSFAQYPSQFPFKTFIDSDDNLYVTGSNDNGDIFFTKYNSESAEVVSNVLQNPDGPDRGTDIYYDEATGSTYITGYKYNTQTLQNEFVLLKYDINGQLIWERTYGFADSYGNESYAMEFKGVDGIYICGATTEQGGSRNFACLKYNESGTLIWSSRKIMTGDETATSIDSDAGHIYIMGTKTEDFDPSKHDMMMLTYDLDGSELEYSLISRQGTDEYALALSLVMPSQHRLIKSRAVIVGYSISSTSRRSTTRFITAYFEIYNDGTELDTLWIKEFGTENKENIATSVVAYPNGDVAVSGYYYNPQSNSTDFGTLKYQGSSGTLLWGPEYFDNSYGIDKASSLKRNASQIAVSGFSQFSANSFVIAAFTEGTSNIELDWSNLYTPDYLGGDNTLTDHNTFTHILGDSSILCFVASWNPMYSRYSAVKYSKDGDLINTIEPYGNRNSILHENSAAERTGIELKIYPNPFNPVSNISFNISEESYVKVKIFDLLGRETASLYDGKSGPGSYNYPFNAGLLPSGVYFCKIQVTGSNGNFEKIQKMVLLK